MRKNYFLLVIILGIIIIIFFAFYFLNFHEGFSKSSQDWGNFGSYFSGITGLIAFAGVLLTINISQQENNRNEERSIFYEMLKLYNNKVLNVECDKAKGVNAFKKYTEIANLYYGRYLFALLCNKITSNVELLNEIKEKCKSSDKNKRELNYFYVDLEKIPIEDLTKNEMYISGTKCCIPNDFFEVLKDHVGLTKELIYNAMKLAADQLYKNYGHILGHYFRTLYYAFKTIDGLNIADDEHLKCRNIFRAQISRYEIALNLYNAVSKNSSEDMIKMLRSFDIFKDLYKKDLLLFNDIQLISDKKDENFDIINYLLNARVDSLCKVNNI